MLCHFKDSQTAAPATPVVDLLLGGAAASLIRTDTRHRAPGTPALILQHHVQELRDEAFLALLANNVCTIYLQLRKF